MTIWLTSSAAKVTLGEERVMNLEVLEKFSQRYNGCTLLSFTESVNSADLHMYPDSSKGGYGATVKHRYITRRFPAPWKEYDIQVLEMFPVFLVIHAFKKKFRNREVTIHSDNLPVVHALNSFSEPLSS